MSTRLGITACAKILNKLYFNVHIDLTKEKKKQKQLRNFKRYKNFYVFSVLYVICEYEIEKKMRKKKRERERAKTHLRIPFW